MDNTNTGSPIPMLLAASGCAAEFCASPEIWPLFEAWVADGMDGQADGTVSRDTMTIAASVVLMIVQGMEREMIAAGFADLLGKN